MDCIHDFVPIPFPAPPLFKHWNTINTKHCFRIPMEDDPRIQIQDEGIPTVDRWIIRIPRSISFLRFRKSRANKIIPTKTLRSPNNN